MTKNEDLNCRCKPDCICTTRPMEDAAQREPADSVCADNECPATSSTTDGDTELLKKSDEVFAKGEFLGHRKSAEFISGILADGDAERLLKRLETGATCNSDAMLVLDAVKKAAIDHPNASLARDIYESFIEDIHDEIAALLSTRKQTGE